MVTHLLHANLQQVATRSCLGLPDNTQASRDSFKSRGVVLQVLEPDEHLVYDIMTDSEQVTSASASSPFGETPWKSDLESTRDLPQARRPVIPSGSSFQLQPLSSATDSLFLASNTRALVVSLVQELQSYLAVVEGEQQEQKRNYESEGEALNAKCSRLQERIHQLEAEQKALSCVSAIMSLSALLHEWHLFR